LTRRFTARMGSISVSLAPKIDSLRDNGSSGVANRHSIRV
jgi:hypothetical protein